MNNIFYVYVLFDWQGVPRYVGKGKGNRWLGHETKTDVINVMKNEFIEQTWSILGEIPKIKILENLTEKESHDAEIKFIKIIGRYPNGPLTNMHDGGTGGAGPSSVFWSKPGSRERFSTRMTQRYATEEGRAQARFIMNQPETIQKLRNAAIAQFSTEEGIEQQRQKAIDYWSQFDSAERVAIMRARVFNSGSSS